MLAQSVSLLAEPVCTAVLMLGMLQVRFGGRTGAAPVLLGIGKLALGLLFGSSLLQLLQRFPQSLLGAMLVFSGAACRFRACLPEVASAASSSHRADEREAAGCHAGIWLHTDASHVVLLSSCQQVQSYVCVWMLLCTQGMSWLVH